MTIIESNGQAPPVTDRVKEPVTNTVTTSIETVTPEMAGEWLAHNHINRKLRWTVVTRYARDMAEGLWRVGGATIDFDIEGNLLNGQHRLQACVEAGVPFMTIIVRGLPSDTQVTMDVGLKRGLSDILSWRGETNTANLAASVNMGWKWQNDLIMLNTAPSHQEALAWLDANPTVREAVRITIGIREVLSAPPSAMATFAHQILRIEFEEAEAYLKHLREGEGLVAGDPILAMRNWMINQISRKASGAKPSSVVYLAMLVKSWNAWVLGRSLNNMVWRRGGDKREDFPVLLDHEGQAVAIEDELRRDDLPTTDVHHR